MEEGPAPRVHQSVLPAITALTYLQRTDLSSHSVKGYFILLLKGIQCFMLQERLNLQIAKGHAFKDFFLFGWLIEHTNTMLV